MSDTPTAEYPPLPHGPADAVAFLNGYVSTWRSGLFPDAIAALTALTEGASLPAIDSEILERRQAIAAAGLDPDLFIPIPPTIVELGGYRRAMTFSVGGLAAWVGSQFDEAETAMIVAQVEPLPAELADWFNGQEARTVEVDGRVVQILL